MDIIKTVQAIGGTDMLVLLGLAAMFVLGFVQGIVRRLFGIAAMLVALVLAAQLRDPVGSFLAANWGQFPREYGYMVGFLAMFVAGVVGTTVAIQWFYRPAQLFRSYHLLEQVIAGLLGMVQGLVLIGAFLLISDPYYTTAGATEVGGELTVIRTVHAALADSATGEAFRHSLLPPFVAIAGWFLPAAVRDAFPSR